MTPAALKALPGGHWAAGRIEVQAAADSKPWLIATVKCETVEQAEETAQNLIGRRDDLVLLRIVLDGHVPSARVLIGRRAVTP